MRVKCVKGLRQGRRLGGRTLLEVGKIYDVVVVVFAGYRPEKGIDNIEKGYILKGDQTHIWNLSRFQVVQ